MVNAERIKIGYEIINNHTKATFDRLKAPARKWLCDINNSHNSEKQNDRPPGKIVQRKRDERKR